MKLSLNQVVAFGLIAVITALILMNNQDFTLVKENKTDINEDSFIAQIANSVGSIEFKTHNEGKLLTKANYPENLYHKSTVSSRADGSLQLSILGDWVIDLKENTTVEMQNWGEGEDKKILFHIIEGSYEVINEGEKDRLIVLYKNKFYTPGSPLMQKQSLVMEVAQKTTTKNPEQDSPAQDFSLDDNKLLNPANLVEVTVFKKKHLFEKCLANRLREQSQLSGRILVGFNITPFGALKNTNIIDNKTQDKKIESCVLDVFKQIKVKNYDGDKTFFAFPIDFR